MTAEGLGQMARGILERKLLASSARAEGLDKKADVSRLLTRAADTLLAQALLEQEAARLDTSDASLRRYYDTHQAAFRTTPRRKAHHIVVKTSDEAVAALAEVNAGKPFDRSRAHGTPIRPGPRAGISAGSDAASWSRRSRTRCLRSIGQAR